MTEEVNFDQLNLKISDFTKGYPIDIQKEIFEYLNELDEIHRKGYQIAYDHLGTSFNITRSNGFKSWQNKKKSN
jgi:tRNA U34 5-carboxymethylaminomethyl modifying enzyme MnmG/GidA